MMRRLLTVFSLLLTLAVVAGAATATPWKFALFCDSRGEGDGVQGSKQGVRTSVLGAIAKAVAAEKVDLVIFPGDLVNGSAKCGKLDDQLKVWRETMAPIYDAHIPLYTFRGNHEDQQDEPAGNAVKMWDEIFPDMPKNGPPGQEALTYRVDHRNAMFVAIDQYAGRSKTYDAAKYDSNINYGVVHHWVLKQIKETTAPWVFACGHEMAFIGHHTDCMANAPEERDQLWDALGARGGIYFCGHDHMYLRQTAPDRKNRPVITCVVGCAGAPLYPLDHEALNKEIDRHVVPTNLFLNAALHKGINTNTHGDRPNFGYLVVTVDDHKLIGEWKAFTNYDYVNWTAPAEAKFVTLDKFEITLPAKAK